MNLQYTPLVWLYVFAALTTFSLAAYIWRLRPTRGATAWAWAMLSCGIWATGVTLEIITADLFWKLLVIRAVVYLGVVSTVYSWTVFTITYSHYDHWLTRRTIILLGVIPVVTYILVLTIDLHTLFYRSYGLIEKDGLFFFDKVYGPAFWVWAIYGYIAIFGGSIILIQAVLRFPNLYRGQAITVILGGVIPTLSNILWVTVLSSRFPYDPTSLFFTLSGILIALSIRRYRFLDVVPVAYDLVFKNVNAGVVIIDLQGRVLDMNPVAEQIVNRSKDEVLGKVTFDAFVDFTGLLEQFRTVMEVKTEITMGQEKRICELQIMPLNDRAGKLAGRIIMVYDITALKKAEERYRKLYKEAKGKEERYQSLLNSTLDAIVIYDIEGRTEYVNDAFTRMFGYTVEEIRERVPFVPESEREITTANVMKVVRDGIPVSHFETKRVTKDDRILNVNISASRFKDLEGHPAGMVVFLRDITKRKETEKKLTEAKEQAEAANRAKSAFLANMSHELRTPLSAVLGFSQLMRDAPEVTTAQSNNLDIINRSGKHLLNLINGVLDMSKIEAGRLQLEPEDFDLGELLRDTTDMMRLRAEAKGLQLIFDQTSDFPRFIHGDSAKLRQILINLLSNSVKFTESGGVTLRLDAEGDGNGGLILHGEVQDTGIGIKPEDIKRIFMPFEQLDKSVAQEGTGLGLAITRQFVGLMQGEIGAESTPGKGSLFHFKVLVERAKEEVVVKAAAELRKVIGLESGQPDYRILIVEDQLENRRLLQHMLEQVGFKVHIAENGKVAVEQFQQWHPHFIWMDWRMPVMNGFTATRRIKAMEGGKETIIVSLTASVFEEQRDKMMESGSDDFLRKPFRLEEIFNMMAKHLKVRYIYAEEQPTTTAEAARMDLPLSEAMAALPAEWLAVLARAAEEIDMKAAEQIISRIGARDKALAESLANLVKDFRFDALQDLVKEAMK